MPRIRTHHEYYDENGNYDHRKYNDINIERIKRLGARIKVCECGVESRSDNMATHKKSARHLKTMARLKDYEDKHKDAMVRLEVMQKDLDVFHKKMEKPKRPCAGRPGTKRKKKVMLVMKDSAKEYYREIDRVLGGYYESEEYVEGIEYDHLNKMMPEIDYTDLE